MKKGAAIAAVLGIALGVWGYWFYSRPYDAVRLVQCLPQDRSLHVYLNVGLLRSAGILELLAGSPAAEEADYKKFVEQTGFDYRTDLDAVAAGFRDGDEYFAVQGRFKWDRLSAYAQSHQGKCQDSTCSMPASQLGKTISFSLLRRDVLAMAVAHDPQASRVIFPGFWKEPPKIPSAAIWVSAPPYVFADATNLPAGLSPFRTQLAQARSTVFTLGPAPDQKTDQRSFELRMVVDCTAPGDASKMATQFSSVTELLKKMLDRDKLKPAAGDLSGVLVAGHFEAQMDQVTGTWPIERKFIESLVSGKVE
jgi:hypothetical protein